jgi:fido (protein-threonine AMPylation protein)
VTLFSPSVAAGILKPADLAGYRSSQVFIFVFIHPYMDGNGRLSRFLMNCMLTTGGYPWTIVTVQSRRLYLAALEQASTYGNIVPFAELIGGLVASQAAQPLERITQRPESGEWTAPRGAAGL